MLPCFCTARQTHVLPCRLGAASLLVAWCHGWVGWGTKIFCRSSLPFQGGCIRSQLRSRLPDGGRMSSGSVVPGSGTVSTLPEFICRGANMPVLG